MRWLALLLLAGCIEPVTLEEQPKTTPMQPGETRRVELRFRRLDVLGFQQVLNLDDLRAIPKATLDEVWLLDLPMRAFTESALSQLRDMDEVTAQAQPVAVQNMRRLMNMTPDNADLRGTNLEDLTALSRSIGIPPQRTLAQILQKELDEPIISLGVATDAMLEGLIGSHPVAQLRNGPVDAEHPDGRWPVTRGALPVTLGDVVDNFAGLTDRFGPDGDHPGFIVAASGFSVIEEAFEMRVRVNGNALPYKGVDLTNGTVAAINSVGSQIDTLFATDRPDWLELDGLVPNPSIETITVRVKESDEFVRGGLSREPRPLGDSPGWTLEPWLFERMVLEMGRLEAAQLVPDCIEFTVGAGTRAFEACVDGDAWITFETFDDAGNPPPPAYLWDLQLEMAQVRLHDGGLAEGEGDIELTIHDVPLGVDSAEMVEDIKRNIATNPRVLREFAAAVADTTWGEADFYYYRSGEQDWLYFVTEGDIPRTASGERRRPYAYAQPGFYADEGLAQKVSSLADVDGDTLHEKVPLEVGRALYVGDGASVHRITAVEKPGRARVVLEITRVR